MSKMDRMQNWTQGEIDHAVETSVNEINGMKWFMSRQEAVA